MNLCSNGHDDEISNLHKIIKSISEELIESEKVSNKYKEFHEALKDQFPEYDI